MPRRPSPPAAFTLLEVILALVILGGSLAVLGEVMQLANSSATDARAETQAHLLANNVMDELQAGVIDLSETTRQPLEVDGAVPWLYSVHMATTAIEGVYPVEVIVGQDLEKQFRPVSYRLVRFFPTVEETDEQEEEAEAATARAERDRTDDQSQSPSGGGGAAGGSTSGSDRGAGGRSQGGSP